MRKYCRTLPKSKKAQKKTSGEERLLNARFKLKKSAKDRSGKTVIIVDDIVTVDLSLAIAYGYNIPETCRKVQQKVQTNIENMTGLKVAGVNLRIAGLNMN